VFRSATTPCGWSWRWRVNATWSSVISTRPASTLRPRVRRYLVVCHPFRASTFCGTPVARRLVLGLLLAFLAFLLAFLGACSHYFEQKSAESSWPQILLWNKCADGESRVINGTGWLDHKLAEEEEEEDEAVACSTHAVSVPWLQLAFLLDGRRRPLLSTRAAALPVLGRRQPIHRSRHGTDAAFFSLFLFPYYYLLNIWGGWVAERLAWWTQTQKGLSSNRSRDAVG